MATDDARTIVQFLDDLVAREDLLEAYEHNPEDTMTGYGLSPDDQALILSNDLGALRARLGGDENNKVYIIVHSIVHIIFVSEPHKHGHKHHHHHDHHSAHTHEDHED